MNVFSMALFKIALAAGAISIVIYVVLGRYGHALAGSPYALRILRGSLASLSMLAVAIVITLFVASLLGFLGPSGRMVDALGR